MGRLAATVGPVLEGLLTAEEIERVRLVRQLGGDGADEPEILLVVTVRGEEFRHYLWRQGQVDESGTDLQERLAGELQDFIAESGFAWGQQRPWPPTPL